MAEEEKKELKEAKEIKLTKQELINIQKLLYAGNFGLSLKEANQAIAPLINKLSKMVDEIK